ncbi:FAD-dependent oxidoreductase [Chitinasiproducens palmae]|uniref:Glycine oxidase n=1 Tax=Chitinasiproducens palmae TaxID=1770053 RepID=A0A1H2PVH4_9BURK|nr:FAD-dependent oxidoreductase [Chitinasiproducens palmae]SDV51298.1 glycine oxidase [Chitinasiproducens palmae]
MTFRFDYAVLGGGLSGRLLAWRLAGGGARVALYEAGAADGSGAAAWVAAAMLAPLAEAAVAEPLIAALGDASLAAWPGVLAALPRPVFFQREGTLVVWHARDRAEATIFRQRLTNNAPPALLAGGIEPLDAARLASVEPALSGRFGQGLLLPHEGQLDNRQLLAALGAGLAERGVACHFGQAVAHAPVEAALTLDCRGLGALGAIAGLRGIRGEVARVRAPGIGLRRPVRMLHPRYPIYIAPKQDDVYVIGATEIEGDDRSPVSVRSALELLSAAFSLHPAFGEARILELNSQSRPTLADHRPAILLEGGRMIRLNGLYRHGYMLAPAVTELAAGLAQAVLAGDCHNAETFSAWRARSAWPALLHRAEAQAA